MAALYSGSALTPSGILATQVVVKGVGFGVKDPRLVAVALSNAVNCWASKSSTPYLSGRLSGRLRATALAQARHEEKRHFFDRKTTPGVRATPSQIQEVFQAIELDRDWEDGRRG